MKCEKKISLDLVYTLFRLFSSLIVNDPYSSANVRNEHRTPV